ncbi:hypothetical protein CCHR01_02289 [Colletotrichum chrysophilum]|uniref:Uncharacterized protein n=1 Tax=Colletotrichum chrysophilum TaxID=1836956 RepID=A0AAD9EKG9_9PEZI|nr:hypothetical protein CCHR01_02289 [Colletotrichum chrysophilum]
MAGEAERQGPARLRRFRDGYKSHTIDIALTGRLRNQRRKPDDYWRRETKDEETETGEPATRQIVISHEADGGLRTTTTRYIVTKQARSKQQSIAQAQAGKHVRSHALTHSRRKVFWCWAVQAQALHRSCINARASKLKAHPPPQGRPRAKDQ